MQSFILTIDDPTAHLEKIIELTKLNLSPATLLNSPDFHLIDNKGAKIGIDQIRQLIFQSALKPYNQPRKIFVIANAHNLTHESQNALLKTLEEPPADCTIFLATPTPAKLLPTILSRCRVIALSRPDNNQLLSESDLDEFLSSPTTFLYKREKILTESVSAIDLYTRLILTLRNRLLSTDGELPKSIYASALRTTSQALKCVKANVNLRLILANLSLKLDKAAKTLK